MNEDLNDKHRKSSLPNDPAEGGTVMASDVPRVLTVADLLRDSAERAFAARGSRGCTTGHWEIDRCTGGLEPESVWVFGAETNWGKSSMLIMIADENIKVGKRVLIVSSEDGKKVYADRLMLRRTRVCAERFKAQQLQPDEQDRVRDVGSKGEDKPVYLDARGRSVESVAKETRRLIKEHSIDIVAFDYLQAFDSDKRHQDRRNQISYIARALTDVAKLSGIPGIVFTQITIDEGKVFPNKNSVKESKDVGNAAEIVIMGFTAQKPIMRRDGSTLIEAGERALNLDKNKQGRKGMFPIAWDDKSACFNVSLNPDQRRYQEVTGGAFDDFGDQSPPQERYP